MSSWFEKCMPRIKDVKPYIKKTISSLKDIEGVKSIYLWGSYSRNIDKPNVRVKDIDVLAKTRFHSGDLLAIGNKIINSSYSDNDLENNGYDPLAVKFSKKFLTFTKYNIDCWAISIDRELFHWGPICGNRKESEDMTEHAEKYTQNITGLSKKHINKLSNHHRTNWFRVYSNYINKQFKDMPTGWYQTESILIKDILKDTIKV